MAKSLLLDFFRGRVVSSVNLRGLDRVVLLTAAPGRVLLRQCCTTFRKCGSSLPRVELKEMGPRLDLVPRRSREAPLELRKAAHAQPAAPKKRKNTAEETLTGRVGRVFVPPQEVDTLALSRPKGAKRAKRDDAVKGKLARRAAAAADEDAGIVRGRGGGGGSGGGGGGGGGEEGEGAAPRRAKRRGGEAEEEPRGAGFELSDGNVVAGRGLKKAKRQPRG